MPRVNQSSLREEVDRIESEFQRLKDDDKVSSEMLLLVNSMLILIRLMFSIFLEKTTQKNSRNSSIPPSQTGKDESFIASNGAHSNGKTENSRLADNRYCIREGRRAC